MFTVIATRPEFQNQQLCKALEQSGHKAVPLPLLRTEVFEYEATLSDTTDRRETLVSLSQYDGVVCISRAASEWLVKGVDLYCKAIPEGVKFWAMGKHSAYPLQKAGFDVSYPVDGNDSEALVKAILQQKHLKHPPGKIPRWLLVKGVGGRELLAQSLEKRGVLLDQLDVYARELIAYSDEECALALKIAESEVTPAKLASTATSVEILHAWWQLLSRKGIGQDLRDQLKRSLLIVISARIKEEALRLGFKNVVVADGPSNESIVKTLEEV